MQINTKINTKEKKNEKNIQFMWFDPNSLYPRYEQLQKLFY